MACKDCEKRIEFEKSFIEEIPYEVIESGSDYEVRFFSKDVDPNLLKWHWDEENRLVEVVNIDSDWKFQFDNELPLKISLGDRIDVVEGNVHRIIKGTTDLVVKITKY